jgi:hypothetical protein
MAERRTTRTKRRVEDDELVEPAEDELADEDGELAEPADDEVAEDEGDELADDEDEDVELAEDEEVPQQDAEDGGSGRRSRHDRDAGVTAAKAGQLALRQIAELTGKSAEGVTGVEPSEDGWIVGVEVVEDKRIPSSTDILATYETELGMDGDLVSYRRVKRYTRGRGDSEDS